MINNSKDKGDFMKCPYNGFKSCIVEQCPSCNYKETKKEVIQGRYPYHLSVETAIERGMAWKVNKAIFEFVSCKLIDNSVQPVPPKIENKTHITKENVIVTVNRSIF